MQGEYQLFKVSNGLTCILHRDVTTPFAVVNMLYDVGARDEQPDKTGFAHLFEHLMFEGSQNAVSFDYYIQKAGGTSNAFTTNDITNYYVKIPAQNLEVALWLESDRLLELVIDEKKLEVQKNVVIEEYYQRYLNKPYGDVWLLLRPMLYQVHPYRWPTIGADINHIRNATLEDVKTFFELHYTPNNAILCIAGNIDYDRTIRLVEYWFHDIQRPYTFVRNLPQDTPQSEQRILEVQRQVPQNLLLMCFPMCDRKQYDFYVFDFLTDLLALGESSRLYQRLVKQQELFSDIDAYITGSFDPGHVIIEGYLMPDVSFEQAEQAIWNELIQIAQHRVPETEADKIKNKFMTSFALQQLNTMSKALYLATSQLLGDITLVEKEPEIFLSITTDDILRVAQYTFQHHKSSILRYHAIHS